MAFLSKLILNPPCCHTSQTLVMRWKEKRISGLTGNARNGKSYDMVILRGRLEKAIGRLNPGLPAEARADAIRTLTHNANCPICLRENRRIHKLLVEGVDVEYFGEDDVLTSGKVRILILTIPMPTTGWLSTSLLLLRGASIAGRMSSCSSTACRWPLSS